LGIASQATNLIVQAAQASSNALFFTVALSSVVLSVFFVLSLLGWRYLKNRYEKRVLGLRPELR
jgi:cytochrome bd-type quinol oxidase subunit 1